MAWFAFRNTPNDDRDDENADSNLEQIDKHDAKKDLTAITNGNDVGANAPGRQESPDATHSMMTFSDSCSMSTNEMSSAESTTSAKASVAAANNYYAKNHLLPDRPDEESILSSSDGPSFVIADDESCEVEASE